MSLSCKWLNLFFLYNVITRLDTDKVLHAGDNVYKFSSIASFPGPSFQLPTQRQVLLWLLQEKQWHSRTAAYLVSKELHDVWIFCNVYCLSDERITTKVKKLAVEFDKYDKIHHHNKHIKLEKRNTLAIFFNILKEWKKGSWKF